MTNDEQDVLIANVVNTSRAAGFARGCKQPDDEANRAEDAAVDALRKALSVRPEAALMTDEVEETMKRLRSQIPGCDCDNPSQCWEECGTLGHSEKHMKVVKE